MSTNNFYFNNALQVFDVENDFDYADAVDNVKYALKDAFPTGYEVDEYEKDENGGLRGYPGKVIYRIPVPFFVVDVVVRSGYYRGGNFDWTVRLDGSYFDVSDAEYAKTEKKAYAIGKKVTKVLKGYTTTLKKIANMDNGEAIYQVAK